MFATLGHIAMKSFMLVWLYTSPHSWRGLPVPEANAPVMIDGANANRLVICGSGIIVGYGVSSHELALGGSLARSLAALTCRGLEITTITSPRLTTRMAQSQLNGRVLGGIDAVVLSFGVFDLLTFLPANKWGQNMRELTASVLRNGEPEVHIFVLECTAPKMSNFTAAYRRRLLTLTEKYNDEIRSIVHQHDRIHLVNFAPEPEDPDAIEGRQTYQKWAKVIAPDIAMALNSLPRRG